MTAPILNLHLVYSYAILTQRCVFNFFFRSGIIAVGLVSPNQPHKERRQTESQDPCHPTSPSAAFSRPFHLESHGVGSPRWSPALVNMPCKKKIQTCQTTSASSWPQGCFLSGRESDICLRIEESRERLNVVGGVSVVGGVNVVNGISNG